MEHRDGWGRRTECCYKSGNGEEGHNQRVPISHWHGRVTEAFAERSSLEAGEPELETLFYSQDFENVIYPETQFPPTRIAGRFVAKLYSALTPVPVQNKHSTICYCQ